MPINVLTTAGKVVLLAQLAALANTEAQLPIRYHKIARARAHGLIDQLEDIDLSKRLNGCSVSGSVEIPMLRI